MAFANVDSLLFMRGIIYDIAHIVHGWIQSLYQGQLGPCWLCVFVFVRVRLGMETICY